MWTFLYYIRVTIALLQSCPMATLDRKHTKGQLETGRQTFKMTLNIQSHGLHASSSRALNLKL